MAKASKLLNNTGSKRTVLISFPNRVIINLGPGQIVRYADVESENHISVDGNKLTVVGDKNYEIIDGAAGGLELQFHGDAGEIGWPDPQTTYNA